jgi:AAA+ ATPase superfamily predicted ATPase
MNSPFESFGTKTTYTDSPGLHPNLILGSLHLFFWLFFHPSAWSNYVARLHPPLSPDFSLIELRRNHWQDRRVQRLLIQSHLVLPLLPALVIGLILWWQGVPFNQSMVVPVMYILAIDLALSLMIGSVISVAAGIVGGVLVGLAVGVAGSVSEGLIEAIAVPTFISLAIGLVVSVAANIAEAESQTTTIVRRKIAGGGLQIQLGSIVVGVLMGVGVAALVRLGLTTLTGLAIGLPENMSYWSSRAIVVGASFGVALGWRHSGMAGITGGIISGLIYSLVVAGLQTQFFQQTGFLVDSGLAGGLSSGLLFGLSFGVTVVLPFVLSDYIAGPWAGAWAGALGSWGRHIWRNEVPLWPVLPLGLAGIGLGLTQRLWRPLLLYPLEGAWNLLLFQFDRRRSKPTLLRYHSAFWDEFQQLPLTGLADHVLLILERNPTEGQAALAYLRTSRQRWAAQAVQIELEARQLDELDDLAALSQAHHRLVAGDLAGPANILLRKFSHLSRDIEAALNQTSAYHQRLALSSVEERLDNLLRELTVSTTSPAPRFYPVVTHWQGLVANHLYYLVETATHPQEIDNPYIVGIPLTEQQEIFVGRADIVARIEQLLVDQRRPPLLLYGQRRMGKTSLLRNLGRLLPRTVVPLFVDGQRIALASDYADLLYNLVREMSRSAEQQRNLILPQVDYATLADKPFTSFDEWLDAVEQCLERQAYQTALLALDEFEMLDAALAKDRFDETDLLSTLRHMVQHRPAFKVMLAGSHPLEEFQRWASYLINVQVVKIGYLAEQEACQLILEPIKNFELTYEPAASRRILELTRGHPALVQLLCYELINQKNEQLRRGTNEVKPTAIRDDVEAAIRPALASGSFFFADIEQNQIDEAGRKALQSMAAYGEGAVIGREALDQGQTELDETLAQLLQRDLIEPAGNGFRFQVELIRRWFANRQDRP